MARFDTAGDIVNSAAVEVGLLSVSDPYASGDTTFIQLRELLNAAGRELVKLHFWQGLTQVFEFTTSDTDSGTYDLPSDFSAMIPQTGWDKTNRVSMGGPLSAQDWAYLDGRDLVSQSIYASFRLVDNKLDIYPQPPPDGLLIRFEYVSRNWVVEADQTTRKDRASLSSDVVRYDPILITKYLKLKYLEAKGFESSKAALDFENMFLSMTGQDEGAAILSASRNSGGFPYLNAYRNTGDTGFGN